MFLRRIFGGGPYFGTFHSTTQFRSHYCDQANEMCFQIHTRAQREAEGVSSPPFVRDRQTRKSKIKNALEREQQKQHQQHTLFTEAVSNIKQTTVTEAPLTWIKQKRSSLSVSVCVTKRALLRIRY